MKMSTRATSAENLRQFLSGVVFQLDAQGIKIRLFGPRGSHREIIKGGEPVPYMFFDLDGLFSSVRFISDVDQKQLVTEGVLSLRSVKMAENVKLDQRHLRHLIDADLKKPQARANIMRGPAVKTVDEEPEVSDEGSFEDVDVDEERKQEEARVPQMQDSLQKLPFKARDGHQTTRKQPGS